MCSLRSTKLLLLVAAFCHVGLEIFNRLVRVSLDGVSAGGPLGGAALSGVRVGILEALQQAERLIYATPHLLVVYLHQTYFSCRVCVHDEHEGAGRRQGKVSWQLVPSVVPMTAKAARIPKCQ